MLTPEEVKEIKARADKATPGPWRVYMEVNPDWFSIVSDNQPQRIVACADDLNSHFIHCARTDIPELCDSHEELRKDFLMGVVEKCRRYHIQNCHECPRLECCDNTSPAKEEITKLRAEVERLSSSTRCYQVTAHEASKRFGQQRQTRDHLHGLYEKYRKETTELGAEVERLRVMLVEAAQIGYTSGHNDTVENRYADPEEIAQDICKDLEGK